MRSASSLRHSAVAMLVGAGWACTAAATPMDIFIDDFAGPAGGHRAVAEANELLLVGSEASGLDPARTLGGARSFVGVGARLALLSAISANSLDNGLLDFVGIAGSFPTVFPGTASVLWQLPEAGPRLDLLAHDAILIEFLNLPAFTAFEVRLGDEDGDSLRYSSPLFPASFGAFDFEIPFFEFDERGTFDPSRVQSVRLELISERNSGQLESITIDAIRVVAFEPIPEPNTAGLLLSGLVLGCRRRHRLIVVRSCA